MPIDDFLNYQLPDDRIAQHPAGSSGERSSSQLLYARRTPQGLSIEDGQFFRLPSLLRKGDLLVLNDSRVVPCRFFVRHGTSEIEILLLERRDTKAGGAEVWEALARPMRKLRSGDEIKLSERISAAVVGRNESGDRIILELSLRGGAVSLGEAIEYDGSMPIPGYIRNGRAESFDRDLYQTVFARSAGSVAAPTAGLHFTPRLLEELKAGGIDSCTLTLHVGPASFQPVRDRDNHPMPYERFTVPNETAQRIERARSAGGRVVGVGTTTTRCLESVAHNAFEQDGERTKTKLFIKPGFQFRAIDLLITNFHQPQTSHLLLVAAFIGEKETAAIYEHALRGSYRFLSYGDAMLLENDI
ncbi:MAG: tRNA preQ1(34) S-adenosylmethionine ribosyltransferase-isomerase QueA [Bdellovibrionota bacterium]